MTVFRTGPHAVFLMTVVFLSTGCLVEKERNPGAKAAQRAAERRRTISEQTAAEAQVVKASGTLRASQVSKSDLALARPQDPPAAADQIIAILEPMVPANFDCSSQIAKRTLDHYSGETEISGPTVDIINGLVDSADRLPVIYKETFEIDAGEVEMKDLLPGEYLLQLDLANGQTSRIYQRGLSYVSITGGTKAVAKVEFRPIGAVISDESGSLPAADEAAMKPYSEVCPSGRTKATTKVYRPQYIDAVKVYES